jgi:hypothetical protein
MALNDPDRVRATTGGTSAGVLHLHRAIDPATGLPGPYYVVPDHIRAAHNRLGTWPDALLQQLFREGFRVPEHLQDEVGMMRPGFREELEAHMARARARPAVVVSEECDEANGIISTTTAG